MLCFSTRIQGQGKGNPFSLHLVLALNVYTPVFMVKKGLASGNHSLVNMFDS